jgi:hypothetical protein
MNAVAVERSRRLRGRDDGGKMVRGVGHFFFAARRLPRSVDGFGLWRTADWFRVVQPLPGRFVVVILCSLLIAPAARLV